MELWLRSGGETKMPCWFAECFHGSTAQIDKLSEYERPLAWWAMQHEFMFTLDPTVAQNLARSDPSGGDNDGVV